MIEIAQLEQWEQRWRTDIGAWFPGEKVLLWSRNVFTEMADTPWMGYLLFAITGRDFTPEQVRLFEGFYSLCASYPDPRLWNNRMAALAATTRSPSSLGLAAGIAVQEALIFGNGPAMAAYHFVTDLNRRLHQGESLHAMLQAALEAPVGGRSGAGKNRQVASLPGFGRPLHRHDERLAPFRDLACRLGLADGEHLHTVEKIEPALAELGQPLKMNIATMIVALSADQGLTATQFYHYVMLCCSAGIIACAKDAQEKPEGAFFPLRCSNIHYEGPPLRQWQK